MNQRVGLAVNDEIVKEFNSKLNMFETSLNGIYSNLKVKLDELAKPIKEIAESTDFLKKMKVIYDNQNKKLLLMEGTLDELSYRLDAISNGTAAPSGKKKKRRK